MLMAKKGMSLVQNGNQYDNSRPVYMERLVNYRKFADASGLLRFPETIR